MAARSAASARTSAACSVSFNVSERGGAFCHESRASRFVASACNQGHRNAASEFENATTRIAARSKDILRLPNSGQKLTRPATGPPAEPARQHTRLAGGTPPASLIARRFAARCIAVASYMHRRRRAASASARGPWPCSLGRSRWADESNVWAKAPINQRYFGTTMSRTFLALAASGEHAQHTRRSATVLRRDETLYVLCGNHKP